MKKPVTIILAVASIAAVMLGFFIFTGKAEDREQPEPVVVDSIVAGLGITYLPITPGLSEYYGLGVEHGVLVTEVSPGSPAHRAGLRVGDVILSFNGKRLEEPNPLLGMMMDCPAGNTMILEIWSQGRINTMQFVHKEK